MTFKTLRYDVDADGIATITWDMPGRTMNVLAEDSLADYGAAIDQVIADPAVKGVVITSGKPDFIAGADLAMLERQAAAVAGMTRREAAQWLMNNAMAWHGMLRRLETCGKPVATALTGTALGGGLEVALATHYRVAADKDKAQIGLPEVQVGLMPGLGGTQRLPRLLGVMAAAPTVLEGKPLSPKKAKGAGIVHEVVPAGEERAAAKAWVRQHLEEGAKVAAARASGKVVPASFDQPWDQPKFKVPGGAPYHPQGFQVFMGGNAMVRKNTWGLYAAPKAILQAVYEGLQLPFDRALKVEARYFVNLMLGDQARNMIRTLFLSRQALEKGARRPASVQPSPVRKLGVLGGGGFMGAGIAHVAAAAGIEVVVIDRDAESAARGRTHAEAGLADRVKKGRMTQADAEAALARISTGADYAALAGCDLVIEAVFEAPEVKKDAIEKAEAHLPADAIFASNTSTLPISGLAKNSKRPARFIGIHFFSPVEKMPLVEIILGKQTADAALAKALDFVRQIRKTPIVVNDARFFYANRCVIRYIAESHFMLAEGVKPALIENAARMIGMPVGPLALNDETALDLGQKIRRATQAALGDAYEGTPADDRLDQMVAMNRLGRKTKAGFYDYPEGARKRLWPGLADLFPVADVQPPVEALRRRFLVIQALEAVRALEDKVITDVRDADVGAIFGWGFAPWSGGPLSYIDTMGAKAFLAECRALEKAHGARFAPGKLLKDMARKGDTFYGRFAPEGAARDAA